MRTRLYVVLKDESVPFREKKKAKRLYYIVGGT